MLKKVYYYKYSDINDSYYNCQKVLINNFLVNIFDDADLTPFELPSDLGTNASIYNSLLSLVLAKYNEHAIIKIVKCFNDEDPTSEEIASAYYKWGIKFVNLLNETHDYFMTLLLNYNNAKADLMADITATTKNKVKFNDTPQNPNNLDVYEGDNYITNFTKSESETKSPLMSKIMRLKEIQDAYKDAMSDWVRSFERIFYQEEV